MRNGVRAVLTATTVIVPELLILRGMGWTNLAELSLAFAFAAVATLLVVLISARHRRHDLSAAWLIVVLAGWVAMGVMLFGNDSHSQAMVAVLLLLPGLAFLILEALGLTPAPRTSGPLP